MKMKLSESIKNLMTIILIVASLIFIIPIIFGIRPFVVMSGSMSPAVETGSLAFINTRVEPSDLHVGDIVAYDNGGMIITHRIVTIENDMFITKGDANESDDRGKKAGEEIVGKLLYSVPYMGYFVYALQAPLRIIRRN